MDNEEKNMEEENEDMEQGTIKSWFQDNLRIIISIVIVVAIAGGVYSYSKRSQTSLEEQQAEEEELLMADEEAIEISEEKSEEAQEETAKSPESQKGEVASAAVSKETENSFVESANKGEGVTHLARRALANYLEKNPDSALTAEHKIFIEDYLRKNAGHGGAVHIGTSVEFSKDLIQKSIDQSKMLNDNQLKNLEKYSARVPSLS